MKTFWQDLPRPIYILAPMEGVTDTVFRRVINLCGRPTVYFTEFTNVDGLFSKGKKAVEHRLFFKPEERPLIAQIWGMKPENYTLAAEKIVEMGFDGIDINMGCPEKSVVHRGACAGLIHNHTLAGEIIAATKAGAGSLPVSVKTRIGIKEIELEEWISFLLEQNIDALTVHARTVKEMSHVPAHWDQFKKVVELKDKISPTTIIIGNGDIESQKQAKDLIKKYKIDGVMVGRGIFKNPFLFAGKSLENLSYDDRMNLLLQHSVLFEKEWALGPEDPTLGRTVKHFEILRKFYKIYTLGLPNATDLREKLMTTKNVDDVKKIISETKSNVVESNG